MARQRAEKSKSILVQYKLRIHQDLRRAIEKAAKENGVSANYEMARRLENSFEQTTMFVLDSIAKDIEINWARWAEFLNHLQRQNAIVDAAKALIETMKKSPSKERERTIELAAGKMEAEIH